MVSDCRDLICVSSDGVAQVTTDVSFFNTTTLFRIHVGCSVTTSTPVNSRRLSAQGGSRRVQSLRTDSAAAWQPQNPSQWHRNHRHPKSRPASSDFVVFCNVYSEVAWNLQSHKTPKFKFLKGSIPFYLVMTHFCMLPTSQWIPVQHCSRWYGGKRQWTVLSNLGFWVYYKFEAWNLFPVFPQPSNELTIITGWSMINYY